MSHVRPFAGIVVARCWIWLARSRHRTHTHTHKTICTPCAVMHSHTQCAHNDHHRWQRIHCECETFPCWNGMVNTYMISPDYIHRPCTAFYSCWPSPWLGWWFSCLILCLPHYFAPSMNDFPVSHTSMATTYTTNEVMKMISTAANYISLSNIEDYRGTNTHSA